MLKDFTTSRLTVRRLQLSDAAELSAISDTPLVSQWMSFMNGGFSLKKAEALIASQETSNEIFFSLRLADGTLVGATGMVDHNEGLIEVGYWLGVDYHGNGYAAEAVTAMLDQIASDPNLGRGRSWLKQGPTTKLRSGCSRSWGSMRPAGPDLCLIESNSCFGDMIPTARRPAAA